MTKMKCPHSSKATTVSRVTNAVQDSSTNTVRSSGQSIGTMGTSSVSWITCV